jgi:hypothetical protein
MNEHGANRAAVTFKSAGSVKALSMGERVWVRADVTLTFPFFAAANF